MDNTIDLDQLSRIIIQTTSSLLSIENTQFDIDDEDLVFTESSETHFQTKNILRIRFGKPFYRSLAKTIQFDDAFRRNLRLKLKLT